MAARSSLPRKLTLTRGTLAVSISVLLSSCAASGASHAPVNAVPVEAPASELVPVLRSGRYSLIELTPAQDQRDLMRQLVNVTIPATPGSTVAGGIRYVLLQTGYQLCSREDSTQALERLPLPAAHIHLGPMTLRDALTVLGGDAGELQVDPTLREVCFQPQTATSHTTSSSEVRP